LNHNLFVDTDQVFIMLVVNNACTTRKYPEPDGQPRRNFIAIFFALMKTVQRSKIKVLNAGHLFH